ncbi:hypothetical protein [Clostridium perfringens]|uniref:hypothetical protein n=1 Tax=Clostridium perfringens TaxID=1502 RepID=UPI00016BD123|nr:hypothetical protein [Clostridium perfringens]
MKFIIEDFKSKGFIKSNTSILNTNLKYVKVRNLYLEIISICNKHCLYCYNEENISKYESIKINNKTM